jgi:hypothetical protein
VAHQGEDRQASADARTLSATATVALRWRCARGEDPVRIDAECAASLRALEACLDADGLRPAGGMQARLEAKIDLLLLAIDRLRHDGTAASEGGAHARFLCCEARFGPCAVEWDDPLAPPVDVMAAILEIRAAPDHPVPILLPVTLARHPAPADRADAVGAHMVATLGPMPATVRDAYERCVFILHRQAVRRTTAKPVAG